MEGLCKRMEAVEDLWAPPSSLSLDEASLMAEAAAIAIAALDAMHKIPLFIFNP